MPSLSEKLKRLLDSIALTDAGEMLSSREKKRLLDVMIPPEHPVSRQTCANEAAGDPRCSPAFQPAAMTAQRRSVVLGVGDTLSLPAMDYAAGACARLDAGLVLLCTDAVVAARLFEPHRSRLHDMGVASRIVALSEPMPGAVADFMQNDPGVLFAVTAGDDPVAALAQRSGKGSHKAPPAPIVMVSDTSPEHSDTLEFRRFKHSAVRT